MKHEIAFDNQFVAEYTFTDMREAFPAVCFHFALASKRMEIPLVSGSLFETRELAEEAKNRYHSTAKTFVRMYENTGKPNVSKYYANQVEQVEGLTVIELKEKNVYFKEGELAPRIHGVNDGAKHPRRKKSYR